MGEGRQQGGGQNGRKGLNAQRCTSLSAALHLLAGPLDYQPVSQARLGWAWASPAAVLSLPTGVLEQLRSIVEDSEDAAPGLQPV